MAFMQIELPWTTVALSAGTAKSAGSIKMPTNQIGRILEAYATHDGANANNAPDVTDFARCTFATNGTSTAQTPGKDIPAYTETVQTTGAVNYTAEPTTVTALRSLNLPQYNGIYHYIRPQGNPLVVQGANGFLVRQNSPNAVNSTGAINSEE